MLTKRHLEAMRPGQVIAQGVTTDDPDGINLAGSGNEIKWIAVRGDITDWAIYADNPFTPCASWEEVRRVGDKIHNDTHIRNLVPCRDDAFEAYRH